MKPIWKPRIGLTSVKKLEEIRRNNIKKDFLLQCRKYNIIPNNITNACKNIKRIHFNSKSIKKQQKKIVNNIQKNLMKSEIKDIHYHMNYLMKKSMRIKNNLTEKLDSDTLQNLINFQKNLNDNYNFQNTKLSKKLQKLKHQQYVSRVKINQHRKVNIYDQNDINDDNNNNNDPWLINCTDTLIPDSVTDIIRLGEKFSSSFLSSKKQHIFEIIKDVESNIDKIPEVNNRDLLRHSIINIASKYLKEKSHISEIDRIIANNIKETNMFIKNNSDLFVTRADKGNITVIMKKDDYKKKAFELLNDKDLQRD